VQGDRFNISLNAAGKVDWSRMRDATRAQLREAVDDPVVRAALWGDASTPSASGSSDTAATAALVDVLYTLIGSAAVVFARTKGFTEAQAEMLRYTEDEKAKFLGPTMKVLSKYDLLGGRYMDEITLAVMVGSVTAAHLMAMQANAAAMRPLSPTLAPPSQGTVAPLEWPDATRHGGSNPMPSQL